MKIDPFFVEVFHHYKINFDLDFENIQKIKWIRIDFSPTNGSKFIPPRILISHKTLWNSFQINAAMFCD